MKRIELDIKQRDTTYEKMETLTYEELETKTYRELQEEYYQEPTPKLSDANNIVVKKKEIRLTEPVKEVIL